MHSVESPAAVLLAALAARDAWEYERVAALADPDSLLQRLEWFCESARPKTLDDFRRWHPDLPEDRLRRWFESSRATLNVSGEVIARVVPGIATYEELLALSPAEFFVRSVAADDWRRELVARLRARGRAVPPTLLGTPPGVRYAVVGEVPEPPDLTHVLYRVVYERDGHPPARSDVEFETARRQSDGAWRLLASSDHFLQPRFGVARVLDDEFADLWGDDAPGPGSEEAK